jgi:hypothetical protein
LALDVAGFCHQPIHRARGIDFHFHAVWLLILRLAGKDALQLKMSRGVTAYW